MHHKFSAILKNKRPLEERLIRLENENKRLRDQLKVKAIAFSQLAEGLDIAAWDLDYRTERLTFSKGYAALFGYPQLEICPYSKSFLDILHSDDRSRVTELFQNPLNWFPDSFKIEYRIKTKSGKWIWISDKGRVVQRNENGIPICIIGIATDVTDQKNNEKLNLKSEEKFRMIAENTSDGIMVIENDTIIYTSPAYLRNFGYSDIKELGSNLNTIIDLIHPEERNFVKTQFTKALKNKSNQLFYSYRARTKNGNYTWREDHARFQYDENLNPISIYIVSKNIDERKKLEQEADRLKTAFLHNITHEIRTPLNGIMGFSNLLTLPGTSQKKFKKYTDIILKSCNDLLEIVDNIINISTIETGTRKTHIENINIADLLESVYKEFVRKIKSDNVKFIVSNNISNKEEKFRSDKAKIQLILQQLIKNAIKYTPEGHIHLECSRQSSFLEFKVVDSGLGIPKEFQEVIFQSFRKGIEEVTGIGSGLGVGLTIALAHVHSLGGKLWLESEKDQGTTVHFTIPAIYNPESKDNKLAGANGAKKQNTILIVEDDECNYLLLDEILSQCHYKTLYASNGFDSIKMIQEHAVDLVFMDLVMPVMSGAEALIEIKALNPSIPVVAYSAYIQEFEINEYLNQGFDAFINKPLVKEDLNTILMNFLA
jgi:PAS domain S-box-containing protein